MTQFPGPDIAGHFKLGYVKHPMAGAILGILPVLFERCAGVGSLCRCLSFGCYRVSLTYCNECDDFSLGIYIVQTPHQHWEEYRLRLALVQLWLAFRGEVTCICQPALKASDCLSHLLPGHEQLDLVLGVALLLN